MPPEGLAQIGSEASLGRAAQPEEIAPTSGRLSTGLACEAGYEYFRGPG